MNSVANQKVRLSDSTTSSDSGVLIEDSTSLEKNGVLGNIKVITTITGNNTDSKDNDNKNTCSLSRSASFCSITSSIILDNKHNDSNNNQHNHNHTKDHGFVEAKNSPDSLRSHNISIVSIDEDDDSSVIDSDSDIENFASRGDLVVQKLGQQTNGSHEGMVVISNSAEGSNCEVITPSSSNASRPNIGSIAVQNSTDITFGNKTFYQGPVTIKQFLLENNKWKPKDGSPVDNPAFDANSGSPNFCEEKKKAPDGSDPRRKFNLDKRTIVIISVILLLFLLIGAIVITSLTLLKSKGYNKPGDGDDSRKNIPINSTIGDDLIGAGKALRMVTRSEWIAQPPNDVLADLELPVNRIIITHTASDNCTTQAACVFHVRFIQTFHMESRHWDDIGYNFLVGGDGAAYEGRGWDKVGAHTKSYNVGSIGIAFIGTFTKYAPPTRQLQVAQLLIQEGVRLGKVSPNYKLYGHRQLIPSESPGEKLFEIIKTWPHWSDSVD